MNSTNYIENCRIENGNTVRMQARSEKARVHLQGSGTIRAFVSVNGEDYKEQTHEETFVNGEAIFFVNACTGDYIKFTATTIEKAVVNWNNVDAKER